MLKQIVRASAFHSAIMQHWAMILEDCGDAVETYFIAMFKI